MKKIIFYIIAILNAFLILTPTTFALPTTEVITSTSTGWGYALNTGKNLTSQYYYKMSSQTGTRATTSFGFSSLTGSDDATHYYWNLQGTSSYFSTEKYMLSVKTVTGDDDTKLTNGHMYAVQTFYCFDDYADDYPTGRSFYNSSTGSSNPTPTWEDVIDNKYLNDVVEISTLPYGYETVGTHDKCFAFNDIFIAQNNISRYGVEFSHTVLTENFPKYYVYGQYLDDLGEFPGDTNDITELDDYIYDVLNYSADVTNENGTAGFSPMASLVLVPSRLKSMLNCYTKEDETEKNTCLESTMVQIKEDTGNGEDEEESGADVNGTITDDDVSGATDSATDLFENFETEDFGISSIITAPLEFIQSLTSDTCQPLSVPIPFTDSNISLPCMTEVYEEHFGTFYDIYKIILVGFLSYRICLNVVRDIEKLKNPTNDKVEVVEL